MRLFLPLAFLVLTVACGPDRVRTPGTGSIPNEDPCPACATIPEICAACPRPELGADGYPAADCAEDMSSEAWLCLRRCEGDTSTAALDLANWASTEVDIRRRNLWDLSVPCGPSKKR